MTKRAVIITTSVLVGVITICAILFGAVFRVREINIVRSDDFIYQVEASDIISAGKLRKGTSIFGVNRDYVANNIELTYPYARVERVNISGFTSVKIKLSNREPLYYVVEDGNYYILDEDCKVLECCGADATRATKYILLNNVFSITEDTVAGQFLSNEYTAVCSNLYKSIYTNAMLNIGEDSDQDGNMDAKYLEREDMCQTINSIKFSKVDELHGKVDKLIIGTSYGVNISIIEPQRQLNYKINSVFSALRELISRGQGEETSGTIQIRYSYDENNIATLKVEYLAR